MAITEIHSFPPPASSQCWAYITLNAEIALTRREDPGVRALVDGGRARISVDSQWIWWALKRRHGARAPLKMSGSDLVYALAEHCVEHGRRLLLLGSTRMINGDAVRALQAKWPGLQISGFAPPSYCTDSDGETAALADCLAAAHASAADFVVIGLSPDKQYGMAAHLAPRLDGVTQGLLCFGGAIDMVSGHVRRAPVRWQRLGLEWLYRVLQQPSRLPRLFRLLPIVPQVLLGRF
jgi:exopolysaccharide biosynthesis WecB/TagA/CpsF family protein